MKEKERKGERERHPTRTPRNLLAHWFNLPLVFLTPVLEYILIDINLLSQMHVVQLQNIATVTEKFDSLYSLLLHLIKLTFNFSVLYHYLLKFRNTTFRAMGLLWSSVQIPRNSKPEARVEYAIETHQKPALRTW